MTENNEELEKLQSSLEQSKIRQQNNDSRIEPIRLELVRIATEAAEKYQQEVNALQPESQRVMSEVIQPWFSQLVESDTYRDLMEWSKTNEEHIRLSNTILYYWPRDALNDISTTKSGERACSFTAKYVFENYKPWDLQRGIRVHSDNDEVWRAYFYLSNSRWSSGNGVILDRDPTIGMGFASAMARSGRRITFEPDSVTGAFSKISPEVWVRFGEQIGSGQVWKNIENSMKPRGKPRVLTIQESIDYKQELRSVNEEYLRNKQWH